LDAFNRRLKRVLWTNLLDTGQDVGFALIISVGTHTQVDLAGVFVRLKSLRDACSANSELEKNIFNVAYLDHFMAIDIPKMGSGGPAGTADQKDTERTACLLTTREARPRLESILKGSE
jgi:hypothetical protein